MWGWLKEREKFYTLLARELGKNQLAHAYIKIGRACHMNSI